jgi:sensor histidine kinase YesM
MVEKWITRINSKINNFFRQSKIFKIKANIVAIVSVYFVLVIITQLAYGLINLNYTESSNKKRDIETVAHYINQSALNIRMELERLNQMARMVYDESVFYFEGYDRQSTIESNKSELNTIINLIFKINDDISGVSIYRPNGGMISYTNPYSPYYFQSGTESMHEELLEKASMKNILMRTKEDKLIDTMLSVSFYKLTSSEQKVAIIVLEKKWEGRKQYYKDLGLLSNGSIILLNSDGDMIMSFRNENAIGDEEIVRSGKLNGKLTGSSGVFQMEAYGTDKYIFYDKSVNYGCTLLYIAEKEFFSEGSQSAYFVIILSSLFLIMLNFVIVILFNKNVYQPITNVESALHSIVTGDTELKLENINESNELYPLYNDIHALTDRLKRLIDSEYSAGIMKKQAEIDALQSQINPHFLYNTLESIRGQAIEEGMDEIEKMVKSLADIFRYSITNKNEMVTLEEELRNVDNYLNIQQFRFNNKFIVIRDIEEDTKKCLIPKLVIQPLVENAIIHGLETKEGKGTIKIKTRSTVNSVIINIEDDGKGIDRETLDIINDCLTNGINVKNTKDIHVGLGLININERIKLIFNDNYGLSIYSISNFGTNIELRIMKTIK